MSRDVKGLFKSVRHVTLPVLMQEFVLLRLICILQAELWGSCYGLECHGNCSNALTGCDETVCADSVCCCDKNVWNVSQQICLGKMMLLKS